LDGRDTDQDVVENAHMGRIGTYRVQHILYEHSMYVFIGSIDTYEYWLVVKSSLLRLLSIV